jgi:glutaredoxin
MDFAEPSLDKCFTVYSKSGCINCSKVKKLLVDNKLTMEIIDCDDYILENKEEFLEFIKEKAGKEYKMFPMVFSNKTFVGGYNETVEYVKNMALNFSEEF